MGWERSKERKRLEEGGAGPGDGLQAVSKAEKSRAIGREPAGPGGLWPCLVGSSESGKEAGGEALCLGAKVKQEVEND